MHFRSLAINSALAALLMAGSLLADVASIRNLIRNGKLAEAMEQCDRELKSAPGSFPLLTLKGFALQGSGDKEGSLRAFRQALAINPSYQPALQATAQIEYEARDARAEHTLQSVLRLSPDSETAHAMLATLLFERRSCEAALVHFERAPSAIQSPSLKWQYGVCLLDRERWTEAAKQFAALLQLKEHAPTRYNLALAYWSAKDYPSVVATLLPLEESGDATTLRLLGSALEASGGTPRAFSVLQTAIRKYPDDEHLLLELAVMCMDHNALELGMEVVRAGMRNEPGTVRLQTMLGVLLVRSGDVEAGKAAFRIAQELSPKSSLGRIGLASTMMQMGLASDAAKVLREQISANGPDPMAELTLVRALMLKNPTPEEMQEALTILLGIVKQESGNSAAHGLLGRVYAQLGNNTKAIAELMVAIRLDPSDRASTYQLMTLYKRMGRTREATELSGKVRALIEKEKEEEGNRFQAVRVRLP